MTRCVSLRCPHRGRTLVRLRLHVRKAPTKHQHVRTMFARSPSYPFPAWIAWRSGSSPGSCSSLSRLDATRALAPTVESRRAGPLPQLFVASASERLLVYALQRPARLYGCAGTDRKEPAETASSLLCTHRNTRHHVVGMFRQLSNEKHARQLYKMPIIKKTASRARKFSSEMQARKRANATA